MAERNCLVLSQYRQGGDYNDFLGKFYHFPVNDRKNYLPAFENLPIEFVYLEPEKHGKGEFYGYGRIVKQPFVDKHDPEYYFVEIDEFKPFASPVYFKNDNGEILEKLHNSKYYNYNNAVRKAESKFLDEICLDGGVLLNFKADSHLVQVLGEQLIASERVGILELVKNAFDAQASYCKVLIENVPDLDIIPESLYQFSKYEGPVIVIEDDGHGMTREQIEHGWLRPASTLKTDVKERLKKERAKAEADGKIDTFESFVKILKAEHKGRIPLGEKGVGRFATHRLGKYLELRTKVAEIDYEFVLRINWDDFNVEIDKPKDLSSIGMSLTREACSRDYGIKNCGTRVIIFGGREGFHLDDREIHQINRTILKLNSPNPRPGVDMQLFHASFECPQVKTLNEKVDYSEYEPVFRITGIVDEKGVLNYDFNFDPPYHKDIPLGAIEHENQTLDLRKVKGFKNQWRLKQNEKMLWRTPQCGPFYIHLDIWYRDRPWKDNIDKPFLEYLSEYGGISVFRDGINVFPAEWGAESDWLGLRQRQIKQSKRLSYYHMLGNVEIQQSTNSLLIDKTNREGMVNNRAAKDFQQLVKAVVFFMEDYYMGKRDERRMQTGSYIREPRPIREAANASSKILSNLHDNYQVEKDPFSLLLELEIPERRRARLLQVSESMAKLQDSLKQVEEVHDLLTEQAGFGLGIAVALHEINKTASNFYYGILELIEDGQFDKIKLERLKHQTESLEAELSRLSPLRALRNELPRQLNVSRSIKFVHSLFKPRFEELGIQFICNEEDFSVIARFGALNQVFTNLIDNSCYWLDDSDITNRKIEIRINSKERTIIIADSGPGISESILPYVFIPGYSLKEPASGLGTYVCKHYLNLMKKRGDIYIAKPKDRISGLVGAQFMLDFSSVDAE